MNNSLNNITCCFTGHRKIPVEQLGYIKGQTRNAVLSLINKGVLYFGAGGALGFDTMAAQIVLDLKAEHPDIKLILVLPCKDQAKFWKESDIAVYNDIKSKADKVVYTSEAYYDGCLLKRNRHLVDSSHFCICYLTEQTGGTAYTVNYAKEKGLEILNII